MTPELVRFSRRIMMLIGRGRITGVDDSGAVQKVQVNRGPASDSIRDRAPLAGLFGLTSNPPVGSDVIVLSVGGDFSNCVAIATNHQGLRPKGLSAGDVWIYDGVGQTVKLNAAGVTVTDQWGNTVAMAEGQMTLTHSAKVIVNAPAVELGGAGGAAVARVGDSVNLTTGKIVSGSTKVTAA